MYYEINVSKRVEGKMSGGKREAPEYRHLFATHQRSVSTEEKLVILLKSFMKAFPRPKYDYTVTKWEESGFGVDVDKLLKKKG